MKKVLLLICVTILLLAGCGDSSKKDNGTTEKQPVAGKIVESSKDNIEDENAQSGMVEVTIPASFFEGFSEEEVVRDFKSNGVEEVTVNGDQSYTFEMTSDIRLLFMVSIKNNIDTNISELVEDDFYHFIQDITYNPQMTEMEVKVSSDSYNNALSQEALDHISFLTTYYQAFEQINGQSFQLKVSVLDVQTGKVIDQFSMQ